MNTYELLETREDGTQVRKYPDGSIRNQNGHLLQLPPAIDGMQITAQTSEHFRKLRKQKILDAIESGVMDITRTKAPAEAIGAIIAKRAEIAMTDDTRTGNEAAKIVLQALDAYQDKPTEDRQTTIRNEYIMDDTTRELIMRIAMQRRTNVLDVSEIIEQNIE